VKQKQVITTALAAILCCPIALARTAEIEDPTNKPAAQWTEKERIGTDVPIEAWKNGTVSPWAVLICIHGFSLHANSFAQFGTRMASLGVPTYAIDVRGFGSWQNTKECDRVDFDAALADIKAVVQSVRQAHPNLPIILLGESMGGALALQAAAENQDSVDGLICSVPSPGAAGQRNSTMKAAVGMVYAPHKPINVGNNLVHRATSQEDVQLDWENDPLSKMDLTPVELVRFQRMMKQTHAKAEKITEIPVLFLQGFNDRLIKPKGTLSLFEKVKSQDKNMLMVGTAEHLIFEQGQFNNSVIQIVTNWADENVVNRSLARSAASSVADSTRSKSGDGKTAEQTTREALGHLKIAQGFLLLNQPAEARDHLLEALNAGRGSGLAIQADKLLLSLPEELIAPPTGAATKSIVNPVSLDTAKANDKPSILLFCAHWIQACPPLLKDIAMALGPDSDKVNVVMIDADDPASQEILREYGIKPLPAVLYLSGTNEVMFYTLGAPDQSALRARIKQLLESANQISNK
jgi:alpha-beta hydrolase superfamily lysophospholipase/thiol-disulfide isomerase/thioredoxin